MESKVNYTLVGVFVLFMLTVIIAVILWLTVGAEAKSYKTYLVYTGESVSGLNPKASVKYRGVEVGRVARVELAPENPEQVKIRLDIETDTPIREDTRAMLVTQGLTGLAYLELTGGSREAAPLKAAEGQDFPVIMSNLSLVTRLDEAFSGIVSDFDKFSAQFEELLSPENREAFSNILKGVEGVLGEENRDALTGMLRNAQALLGDETRSKLLQSLDQIDAILSEEIRLSVQSTFSNFNAVSAELARQSGNIGATLSNANAALADIRAATELLPPVMERVKVSLGSFDGMAKSISNTTENLDAVLAEGRDDLAVLGQETVPGINALLEELSLLISSLQRVTDELERNPQSLVFGREKSALGPGESRGNNR